MDLKKDLEIIKNLKTGKRSPESSGANCSVPFSLFLELKTKRIEEHHKEAEKWKSEGDMYGWNYHEGMAMAYNEMELDIREAQNDHNEPQWQTALKKTTEAIHCRLD